MRNLLAIAQNADDDRLTRDMKRLLAPWDPSFDVES